MSSTILLSAAREAAGLSKTELAERACTSRTTLSAYEHGRVSPTLETVERILAATGHRLTTLPVLHWRQAEVGGGRIAFVADRLPDLPVREAVRTLELPLHLDWSRPGRVVDLADRRQRARAYEAVLREGRPVDIESIVDGALLVDLWHELVLPKRLRVAWEPIVEAAHSSDG